MDPRGSHSKPPAFGGLCFESWHYKGPSRVERRTYGNDATPISRKDSAWDAFPREIDVHHQNGGTFARFQYGYDREHHRLFEKRTHEGNTGDVYRYDSAYRTVHNLQGVDLSGVTPGQEILPENFSSPDSLGYSFDGVQNRNNVVKTVSGTPTITMYTLAAGSPTFDAEVNQYTTVQEGGNPAQGLSYDLNGNLTADDVNRLYFDFKNRLVEVRTLAGDVLVARYSYDALDRRVRKDVAAPTAGGNKKKGGSPPSTVPTRFLHDGIQCVEERDGGDALLRQHVWGPGIDELVQQKTASATYWAHENSIGSVCALTNGGGNVVERYRYDPFGITTVSLDGSTGNPYRFHGARFDPETGPFGITTVGLDGSTGNPYRFHGARFDPETGLYWMRARTYSPVLGRFIQRDPTGVWVDNLNFGNGFVIVGNDVLNYRDPLGLWEWSEIWEMAKDVPGVTREVAWSNLTAGVETWGAIFRGEEMELGASHPGSYAGITGKYAGLKAQRLTQACMGVGERLHRIKDAAGLKPTDNAIIGKTGDVYHPYTGEHLGSLTDPAMGRK